MKKILILKTSSMGDIIHALVAVSDLQKTFSDFVIDWVVEEAFVEIPLMHKFVRKVIPIAWRRWRKNLFKLQHIREIRKFGKEVRSESYDYIIDAQGLLKSAVIGLFARGTTYGYGFSSIREPLASIFYFHRYTIKKNLHAILRMRELFAAIFAYEFIASEINYGINLNSFCGLSEPSSCRGLPEPPSYCELSEPQSSCGLPEFTSSRGLTAGSSESRTNHSLFLFHPNNYFIFIHSTSKADKCWDEKKWVKLAKLFSDAGMHILLPWGNQKDKIRAERIASNNFGAIVLPKLSLTEIADIFLKAKAIVAVDTGLAHLAAALNVPTITLYGPTNPSLIGTLGKNQIHLTNNFNLTADAIFNIACCNWL